MSLFTSVIGLIIGTVKAVRDKAPFTEILMSIITTLPKAIMDAIAYGKISTIEKLDEALEELDLRTGIETGALDVIRDLPADKEEIVFDALKQMIEVLGKNKLKVEGYYVKG